jgi:CRP-like cAMP-binding protein
VEDYEKDEVARDEVRTAVYYAFNRHGIEIPWPIQVEYQRHEAAPDPPERLLARARILSSVDVFEPLTDQERERLAAAARDRLYGNGEAIVRQGEEGASLFVLTSGRAVVTVEPGGEVAALITGDYFGEMSLLTGEPRTATVSARGDCRVFEVDADMFRQIAQANPRVLETVGQAAMVRRTELHSVRDAASAAAPQVNAGFLLRMKKFLRLT